MSYVGCTKRAKHCPSKYRRHARSRVCPLAHDIQMAVDTHPAAASTEDGVDSHMAVDAPLKENVSKFAVGGLILPPPEIKCATHYVYPHQRVFF